MEGVVLIQHTGDIFLISVMEDRNTSLLEAGFDGLVDWDQAVCDETMDDAHHEFEPLPEFLISQSTEAGPLTCVGKCSVTIQVPDNVNLLQRLDKAVI